MLHVTEPTALATANWVVDARPLRHFSAAALTEMTLPSATAMVNSSDEPVIDVAVFRALIFSGPDVPTVLGVPLIEPFVVLKARPAGRVPVSDQETVEMLVDGTMLKALRTLADGISPTKTSGAFVTAMRMLSEIVTYPSVSRAEILTVEVIVAALEPVIAPVAAFSDMPLGS